MENILLVDDEMNVLEGYRRQYRNHYQLCLAQGSQEGLQALEKQGPFAAIISDYNMPSMNGVEFLTKAQQIAPDTVRIMLTGFADVNIAIKAVNEGAIFRFLTKPCTQEVFQSALAAGISQYRLITSEKELLEKTLTGSVKALIEVLAITNPAAMGKASRLKRYITGLVEELGLPEKWKYEVAAMLSPLSSLTLPDLPTPDQPTETQGGNGNQSLPDSRSSLAAQIMNNIPRLEDIVEILIHQNTNFDGSNSPIPGIQNQQIPVGARLLKVVHDFDSLREEGIPFAKAFETLEQRPSLYDPQILNTLNDVFVPQSIISSRSISLEELKPHMTLAQALRDKQGNILVEAGHELSDWVITWLILRSKAGDLAPKVEVISTETLIKKCPHEEIFDQNYTSCAS